MFSTWSNKNWYRQSKLTISYPDKLKVTTIRIGNTHITPRFVLEICLRYKHCKFCLKTTYDSFVSGYKSKWRQNNSGTTYNDNLLTEAMHSLCGKTNLWSKIYIYLCS